MNKVAIIGCGYIGGFADDSGSRNQIYSHAKAISKLDNFEIVSCCDSDKLQLEKFSSRWKIKNTYLDLACMLKNEDVDILVVCTPTRYHVENIKLAIQFPIKAIFCEKPISYDSNSSNEIVKLCKKNKILLAVNFMRRWDQFYIDCKNILDSKELGDIQSIVSYVDTALFMNAIHMIDLILFLAGDFNNVYGKIDRVNEIRVVDGKDDPGAFIYISHKNNISSIIKATGASRRNHYFEIDIQCSNGRIRMLDDGKKYEIYKFKECSDKTWLSMLDLEKTVINNFSNERMLNAYNNIADAIKSNTPLNSSGYSAVKSIELIEEVYKNNLL